MGHAEHDFLHAEIAAALDDLFERGDQRFGAIEAEALGAGELEVAELLEAFRLDQLGQDGPAAFRGEGDLLVRPLDPLLDPGLLLRIGDMHELDAKRLAVGALADRDDLAQRAEFQAEHVVEENLAVIVRVGEAVGARIELLVILLAFDAQRIEIGVEVAAHAVGANQHQGANRITRRLLHVGRAQRRALDLRLRLQLATDRLLGQRPVAVQRRGQVVGRLHRPVGLFPGRALGVLEDIGRLILQAFEELLPLGIDRGGVVLVAAVDFVDVGGVSAVEKGSESESGIRVLARHDRVLILLRRAEETGRNSPAKSPRLIGHPLPYLGRMYALKRTKNWI